MTTTPTRRALVWVDHHAAKIIHPLPASTEFEVVDIHGDEARPHESKHGGGHRHPLSIDFAHRITGALDGYSDLVLMGPSTAKDELMAHLREHHAQLADRVALVETFDHATDAQLAAQARAVFERVDRMHGIHVG